jgi:hypothetical protein
MPTTITTDNGAHTFVSTGEAHAAARILGSLGVEFQFTYEDDADFDFNFGDDDDRGDYANYQMYSKAGNDACEDAVAGIERAAKSMVSDNRFTRDLVIDWMRNAHQALRATHPEARDTEPSEEIAYQVNKRVCAPYGISPIDRFEV